MILSYKHIHVYWLLRVRTIDVIHFMDKLLGLLLQTLVVCSYLWLSYNCKTIDWMQNMKIAFKILFWISNFISFGIIHCQAGKNGFQCIFPSELMMDKKTTDFSLCAPCLVYHFSPTNVSIYVFFLYKLLNTFKIWYLVLTQWCAVNCSFL